MLDVELTPQPEDLNPLSGASQSGDVFRQQLSGQLECLKLLKDEVHASFGKEGVALVQPYLKAQAFEYRRDSLSPGELNAIADLMKLSEALKSLKSAGDSAIAPVGGSGELFLREVFMALIERNRGTAGNPIVLRCTVCPDYPYTADGQYTAQGGLNSGVGLCAQKIYLAVKPLLRELSDLSIPVVLDLCHADIEAEDPVMQRKAGTERTEFLQKVQLSREACVAHFTEISRQDGINCAVTASSMLGIMGSSTNQDPYSVLSERGVRMDHVRGLKSHRYSFYQRFFSEQLYSNDPNIFSELRAAKDIADHVLMAHRTDTLRQQGERITVVTMSIPGLAKYLRHGCDQVPVLAVKQDY